MYFNEYPRSVSLLAPLLGRGGVVRLGPVVVPLGSVVSLGPVVRPGGPERVGGNSLQKRVKANILSFP